jgi:prepilin-type N-terminal cleavage/methylation domain-containing protein
MQKYAFTLVELIVVITILAVLGTIAFVSFQGYTTSARDSVRISDLKVIQKALEFELTKNDILPHPDNYITLSASGANI